MGKPHGTHELCWSCQKVLPPSSGRIWIEEDFSLPVCRDCWTMMPEADRVRLAIAFRDRGRQFTNVYDVLEWLRGMMANGPLAGSLPPWMQRGGMENDSN